MPDLYIPKAKKCLDRLKELHIAQKKNDTEFILIFALTLLQTLACASDTAPTLKWNIFRVASVNFCLAFPSTKPVCAHPLYKNILDVKTLAILLSNQQTLIPKYLLYLFTKMDSHINYEDAFLKLTLGHFDVFNFTERSKAISRIITDNIATAAQQFH